jgi:hypothetical protein
MSDFKWDRYKIDTLIKMHSEKKSYQEIADAIGAPTRATVAGKVHSLRMRKKPVKEQMIGGAKTDMRSFSRLGSKKQSTVPLPSLEGIKKESLNIPMEKLQPSQCRYPYGDETPFLFCGHTRLPGSAYCPDHDKVCKP